MTEKTKTWTRQQIEKLLERQIADCADSIQTATNLSEYAAKQQVLKTPKIQF